jgi:hypothetical protein
MPWMVAEKHWREGAIDFWIKTLDKDLQEYRTKRCDGPNPALASAAVSLQASMRSSVRVMVTFRPAFIVDATWHWMSQGPALDPSDCATIRRGISVCSFG